MTFLAEGKRTTEESRSPLEKYNDDIGKLHQELNVGAISWDTYQRAIARAAKELNDSQGPSQLSSIIMAGSAEAKLLAYKAPAMESVVPPDFGTFGGLSGPITPHPLQSNGPILSPISNNALAASGVDVKGDSGWSRDKVDKNLQWLLRIELNTRTPQIAASSI